MKAPVPLALSDEKLGEVAATGVGATELFASAHFLSMMYQVSHCEFRMGFGEVRIKSTVWSSTLTTFASAAMRVCRFEPLARTRSAEKTTSSAVKGSPFWNLTFLRRWNRQRVGSGVSQLSAKAGMIFKSLSRAVRPSKTCPRCAWVVDSFSV